VLVLVTELVAVLTLVVGFAVLALVLPDELLTPMTRFLAFVEFAGKIFSAFSLVCSKSAISLKKRSTMIKNENDPLHYAMQHTFGIVHAVILTLVTFSLIVSFPSLMDSSFSFLGFIILPFISLCLTFLCTSCIQYVCKGYIHVKSILQTVWIPAFGIFVLNLLILPLKFMHATAFGPFSALMATSIFMNGIITWLLQVYSSSDEDSSLLPT